MRITAIVMALAAAACATALGAQAPASPATSAPTAAPALTFEPTIYGDGASCPGACDAHVVFRAEHNGTRNAFAPPLANRAAPQACVNGQSCMVCVDDTDASCIEATYRGAGPPAQRFDFTAAFFAARCGEPTLPAALQRKCSSFSAAAARYLGADGVYCVAQPEHPPCAERIAAAEAAKAADRPAYEACRADPVAYDAAHRATPSERRAHQCTYSHELTGGPNSRGVRWRRLMPAACPAGSYVGRDGLDCCDRSLISLGGYGRECAIFVARPLPTP